MLWQKVAVKVDVAILEVVIIPFPTKQILKTLLRGLMIHVCKSVSEKV